MEAAVEECIGDGILREYLLEKKSEVVAMFMTEYDEDEVREMFRRDGLAEGRAEGRAEGAREERARALSAAALVREGALDPGRAAAAFGFTADELGAARDPLG